jgi:predicted neuraminidase
MNLFRVAPTFLATLLAATMVADDWKLQPLPYNHPGLTVDLGVGLWAWPMPIDYDGDGDLDLLVACSDVPSNGVYFFENTSQDPTEKFPVFKPGVRLGKATHNFQISHVNGQPRILKPGHEFLRNPTTGHFNFDQPTRIFPIDNIHLHPVRANRWSLVDFDGNGVHDLIVGIDDATDYVWDHAYDSQGQWQNGPLHGHVYLLKNLGTDATPQFSNTPILLTAGGRAINVYGWPSPNFADFDGDGDLDLVCGEFLDGFTYFENIGTRSQPVYATGRRLIGSDHQPLAMHVQMITPTAIDWTGNGWTDLIVGDEDGRVALVEHTGIVRDGLPVFQPPVYFQQEADKLKFGALATPFVVDWDGDGDLDILCGNTAGEMGWFENLGPGANDLPKWAAPVLLEVDGKTFRVLAGESGSIQGPCEAKWGYTTFSVADWDGDGALDIIYNSIHGKLGLLRGTGNPRKLVPAHFDNGLRELPPSWDWRQVPSSTTLTQWRTTPVTVDFTGDNTLDLVLLDQEGYLTLRPGGKTAQRVFIDEDNKPIRLNTRSAGRAGRSKLAVVDWDGDGRLDLLVNSENAVWYRNCEERDGQIVLKRIGNLTQRNVAGHTSSPAVCDLDGDGKPDLLLGAEDGLLYYIRHDDCVVYPTEMLSARAATTKPSPRFPGFVHEEFIYNRAPFPQCHASTLCETSRGLVAAWFGGTREKNPDVGIWVSYHDGGGWSAPKEWANGIQHENLRYPTWNPVLFQSPGDGPTLLFFKTGPDPKSWWGEMMVSYDRGRSFRERRRLPEGIDGPVRCKPMLLADSTTLLCGSSTEHDGWRVHFEKVQLAHGLPVGNWKRIGPIHRANEFNAIQPTFLQHPDGRIQVLCRTQEGVVSTSYSLDQGETWSVMDAISLPNNNSGIEAVSLRDGRHLLIYNHLDSGSSGWGRRGMLNLAISDDGLTWRKAAVIEQEAGGEFSYPAIIQTSDGLVHITYTWKRQKIKHVILDPAQIQPGPILGREPWDKDSNSER